MKILKLTEDKDSRITPVYINADKLLLWERRGNEHPGSYLYIGHDAHCCVLESPEQINELILKLYDDKMTVL